MRSTNQTLLLENWNLCSYFYYSSFIRSSTLVI